MQNRAIDYLENILEYCQDIIRFMEKINYDRDVFLSNKMEQYGVSFCIEQVGELVGKLRKEGYEEKYPDLPWREIVGMRNTIAHGYFTTDLRIVFDTSVNDIPKLLKDCKQILEIETGLEYRIQNAEQRAGTPQPNVPSKETER